MPTVVAQNTVPSSELIDYNGHRHMHAEKTMRCPCAALLSPSHITVDRREHSLQYLNSTPGRHLERFPMSPVAYAADRSLEP